MPDLPAQSALHDGPERRITRWEHEHVLEAVQQRLDANPQAMRQRRETVEHPFGTIKARMGATHFLMKTLPKVATEMALHVLAYNLTRVMNIVGIKPLIAAIGRLRRPGFGRCASSEPLRMPAATHHGCLQTEIGKICSKRSRCAATARSRPPDTPSVALSRGQDPEETSSANAELNGWPRTVTASDASGYDDARCADPHAAVRIRQKQEDLIGTSAQAAAMSRRCLMMRASACLPSRIRHS